MRPGAVRRGFMMGEPLSQTVVQFVLHMRMGGGAVQVLPFLRIVAEMIKLAGAIIAFDQL